MPTLTFPRDLLRFLYWLVFKPITFNRYFQQYGLGRNTSLITLWWRGRKQPELRQLMQLALFHILITPWPLAFLVALGFNLLGFPVNWGGVVNGIIVSVAVGVVFGVALGVAGGVARGVAFSVVVGVAFSVAGGVELSVAGGVAGGVVGGVAGGVSFIVSYFRLWLYWAELPLSWLLARRAEHAQSGGAIALFRFSPLMWHERTWLPLLGLDKHLVAIGQSDRKAGAEAIAFVAQSFRQQWAARDALIELTADDVEQAQTAQAIANIAQQFAWLPPTMPKELEEVLPPIREIAERTRAALESDTLYNQQSQLREALVQTRNVRGSLALGRSRQIATRFGRALETWERVFERELASLQVKERIPNVYVAGSPLATNSKVFKGRRDLFVALERELASAAEQPPTLLLYGPRRIGKSSVLKQLPARLGPDYIPIEIDLQSGIVGDNAADLLAYIARQVTDNALNHRRLRLPTLPREALSESPYMPLPRMGHGD